MALSLTCVCGARFELDDTLAGQNITCPECQQTLKAPAVQSLPPRTSGLALASVVLALVGGFTGIGSAVAVVLGALALSSIARQRERLAGAGLALFGIIAGVAFTALFVFAIFTPEFLGVASAMRKRMLEGQVDTSGKLEHVDDAKGFAITRPSKDWGIARDLDDLTVRPLIHSGNKDPDLLLIQTARYVFVDVRTQNGNNFRDGINTAQQNVLLEFQPEPLDLRQGLGPREDDLFRPTKYLVKDERELPGLGDGVAGREVRVEVLCGGKRWHFLIRLYLSMNRLYVVRAYAQGEKRFNDARPEFDKILDSFELLTNRRPRPAGRE